MVEQDPVAREETVRLTVVNSVPMRSDFGRCVGGPGVKRRRFRLRRRSRSEHLGGSGLVVLDGAAGVGGVRSDGFEEAEGAGGDDVGRVVGDLEGDGDVGLSGEVVDLVGLDHVEPAAERGCVGEIGVVELHQSLVGVVRVDVDVVDPLGVEVGRSADQAVDFVAFLEEELRQVRSVLAGDSGDQCYLPRHFHIGSGSVVF